tara:strand:+ start:34 stop:1995 length:1962 start_codon:yes stop_codon:yes gene_type:complete
LEKLNDINKSFEYAIDIHKKGKVYEALKIYLELQKQKKNDPRLLFQIGNAYLQTGNIDLSIDFYKKVIEIDKNHFNSFNNLGGALATIGRYNDAIDVFEKTLNIKPDYSDAYNNIANCYLHLKKHQDAIEYFNKALEFNKENSFAYNGLGSVYKELNKDNEAVEYYKNAIKIKPDYLIAYDNLGGSLSAIDKLVEAIQVFNKMLELDPNYKYIIGKSIHTKMMLYDWNELNKNINYLVKLLEKKKRAINPFLILSLIDNPEQHKNCSEIFVSDKFKSPEKKIKKYLKKEKDKIKIGYFSPDFRNHPILFLMMDVFKYHDKSKFEVYAFSFGPEATGEIHQTVKGFFTKFINVRNFSDNDLIKLSRDMKIDIAIDLCAYTSLNRASIFNSRVAPIQINYLGYPGTMGANFMDIIIADNIIIPEADKKYYTEKVVNLPNCYQPSPKNVPMSEKEFNRKELGLPEDAIVFCNFNGSFKNTPDIFTAWTNIMKKVPNSVLWIMETKDKIGSLNILKEAEKRKIEKDRIIFAKSMDRELHLKRYQLADLFLDSFPYNAHTTSNDAIRMGVPILTLKGKSFASRVSASILNQVNMNELVTNSVEEFEEKAITLGNDKNRLREIKETLKKNIPNSKLFDSFTFTKDLEKIYKQLINEKEI